jgi:ATP/maltotriose-dependent transcriptional regulator MalT/DNA-binding SARP family transcriptional activator
MNGTCFEVCLSVNLRNKILKIRHPSGGRFNQDLFWIPFYGGICNGLICGWCTTDSLMGNKSLPAKISHPRLNTAGIVQRKRLFDALDAFRDRPVVWLSAPGGSGKTTLVSSYLEAGRIPSVWYRCDASDSDPATFFYYMGLAARKAAPRHKKPLPLLTPEYLPGITIFTHRFFEQLFSRLTPGSCIVLDDYQEIPDNAPFHELIAEGFAMAPPDVQFVVISRGGPPPAFARENAHGNIRRLEFPDIRLTFEETRELVRENLTELDDADIIRMHDQTEGWTAGVILMAERAGKRWAGNGSVAQIEFDDIFDYFAGEIFDKAEERVRDVLVRTALISPIRLELVDELTGMRHAEQILESFSRQNFFTEKLAGGGGGYRYHPLFRTFLLNKARGRFSSAEMARMQSAAGQLLEKAGQIEEAAGLYRDAGDGDGLCRIVTRHARELLAQGRNKTVEEWISAIPESRADDDPWLYYWSGMCAFPMDMTRARAGFEKALASFKNHGDAEGLYLSWAGIVDTHAFELDAWRSLDRCLDFFEEIRSSHPSFPSRDIEFIASSRMLIALTLRKTDQPQWVQEWLDRVTALLEENPCLDIRLDTAFFVSVYYLWKGEYHKNAILLEDAEGQVPPGGLSPLAAVRLKLMKGIHLWITADYEAARAVLGAGLSIAEKSGVHVFDPLLWGFTVAGHMASGHMAAAEDALSRQRDSSLSTAKALDLFFYRLNCAWMALLKGNSSLAAENMDALSSGVSNLGTPYYSALWNIGMAQVAFLQGRLSTAGSHIQTARTISFDMKSHVLEWYSLIIDAYFCLKADDPDKGLPLLDRGLSLARRYGYVHLEFYQPEVMRFLCTHALANNIETIYVNGLIRKLRLAPPPILESVGWDAGLDAWPYPVKIYTFGRFEVVKDGIPLEFAGKVQKKPLEMLKALIAMGGANVPAGRLTDALWPDTDGDLGRKSLETTLGRLRNLLGGETSIRFSAGHLTLEPRYCWVDSMALESLLEKIGTTPADQVGPLKEKAVSLYRGQFLPTDILLPWTAPRRELFRNKQIRLMLSMGIRLEESGAWERAADCYVKGLETDYLVEELYRRLMICHQKLGNNAEAVRIYHRCRDLLKARLGIAPSAETRACYSRLMEHP